MPLAFGPNGGEGIGEMWERRATASSASCARTGDAVMATSDTLAKVANLCTTQSPNTRLGEPASVYPGERGCSRGPCLSKFFSTRQNTLQPATTRTAGVLVSMSAACWLYFAPDFSRASDMEIQQIKSEIATLQARFDALRGYL